MKNRTSAPFPPYYLVYSLNQLSFQGGNLWARVSTSSCLMDRRNLDSRTPGPVQVRNHFSSLRFLPVIRNKNCFSTKFLVPFPLLAEYFFWSTSFVEFFCKKKSKLPEENSIKSSVHSKKKAKQTKIFQPSFPFFFVYLLL